MICLSCGLSERWNLEKSGSFSLYRVVLFPTFFDMVCGFLIKNLSVFVGNPLFWSFSPMVSTAPHACFLPSACPESPFMPW